MINRTTNVHIQPVKACQTELISKGIPRLQSLAVGQRATVSRMYTSRNILDDSVSLDMEDQQPSSSAYEEGNSALDAAWEHAVLEPLPSTPPSTGEAVELMPVHDQMRISLNLIQDRPSLGHTPFCTPGSALEDSEGWENDESDGSALSSIASFDLDKALQELELDQPVASRRDESSSADSKMVTLFYSPAATLQDSPELLDDHMSSTMAGLLKAPCKAKTTCVYFLWCLNSACICVDHAVAVGLLRWAVIH